LFLHERLRIPGKSLPFVRDAVYRPVSRTGSSLSGK
jgi:hypothetical protein